ncbi:NAD kinase, partial [Thioclava sp. BHET1]
MQRDLKLCFVASEAPDAQAAQRVLIARYGQLPIEEASVRVA